jgi:phosphoglycolate phosphatase/pyrophosphatase PpaX
LQKFGIARFFEKIETGHLYGPRKTEGIGAVLNYFKGINKNEITYIGDAPSDIIACKTIGIPIVAAAWADTAAPEQLAELNPEELFYNIHDFSDWIYSRI